MPIEAALIKPVVDALMGLFRRGEDLHLKNNAEAALRDAIRELLLANPDENKAATRIAVAKAAGIISEDVVLAEDMLEKHRANRSRTRGRSGVGKSRRRGEGKTEPESKDKPDSKGKPEPKGKPEAKGKQEAKANAGSATKGAKPAAKTARKQPRKAPRD